jgi:hypothetical protein
MCSCNNDGPNHGGSGCCGGHQESRGHHGGECGCSSGGYRRRFMTRTERIAGLEEYQAELTKELEAVAEAIQDLKRKK